MTQALITIRRAIPGDAADIAAVHDAAWREAYRGVIPGGELERLIARRGPDWWRRAVAQGSRLLVLSMHGTIGGYVSYGRNRALPWIMTAKFSSFTWRRNIRAWVSARGCFAPAATISRPMA